MDKELSEDAQRGIFAISKAVESAAKMDIEAMHRWIDKAKMHADDVLLSSEILEEPEP